MDGQPEPYGLSRRNPHDWSVGARDLGSAHDQGAANLPDLPERRRHSALDLYQDVFDDFEVIAIEHYRHGDIGPDGTVKAARFRLAGSEFGCADSPVSHTWGFTPAVSLWIDCDDNDELERLFDRLSDGGQVFMPLDDYGLSPASAGSVIATG